MRRAGGTVLVVLGICTLLIGVGGHIFYGQIDDINAKIIGNDWIGALADINQLRSQMWFRAAELLPEISEDLAMKESWALYKSGDRERAAKIFRKLASSRGHGDSALFNAATIELSPETFERAIHDYEEVLEKSPGHLRAQKNLEILRQIEREQREDADKDGKDKKADNDASKKRSRTKDKLEYRDGGSDSGSNSSTFRY